MRTACKSQLLTRLHGAWALAEISEKAVGLRKNRQLSKSDRE